MIQMKKIDPSGNQPSIGQVKENKIEKIDLKIKGVVKEIEVPDQMKKNGLTKRSCCFVLGEKLKNLVMKMMNLCVIIFTLGIINPNRVSPKADPIAPPKEKLKDPVIVDSSPKPDIIILPKETTPPKEAPKADIIVLPKETPKDVIPVSPQAEVQEKAPEAMEDPLKKEVEKLAFLIDFSTNPDLLLYSIRCLKENGDFLIRKAMTKENTYRIIYFDQPDKPITQEIVLKNGKIELTSPATGIYSSLDEVKNVLKLNSQVFIPKNQETEPFYIPPYQNQTIYLNRDGTQETYKEKLARLEKKIDEMIEENQKKLKQVELLIKLKELKFGCFDEETMNKLIDNFNLFKLLMETGEYFIYPSKENAYVIMYMNASKERVKQEIIVNEDGNIRLISPVGGTYSSIEEVNKALGLDCRVFLAGKEGFDIIYEKNGKQETLIEKRAKNLKKDLIISEPVDILFDEVDLQGSLIRSLHMKNFLSKFPVYDSLSGKLKIGDLEYSPLTGNVCNISTKPTASCGSSPREVVLMNPHNSPLLNKHYMTLRDELNAKKYKNEQEILQHINQYVRNKIFPSCLQSDLLEKLENFLNEKSVGADKISYGSGEVPLIPIDDFIKEGIGVCRHHGMVVAYLLDRLSKESSEERVIIGIAQHMRDNIGLNGAHVWATCMTKHHKWHIDTLWNIILDLSQPSNVTYLESLYGKDVIQSEIARTAIAAKKIAA